MFEDEISRIRQLRDDINPIRALIGDQIPLIKSAIDRVRWDLSPKSRMSRRHFRLVKNSRSAQRAIILCNGPSLNRVDFTKLQGTFCIGLNKINLLFPRTSFRPNAIVCINDLVIDQNREFYKSTDIPLYIGHRGTRIVQERDNVHFLHLVRSRKFARDISGSVAEGATVTYVALQLAFHLGFEQVALVGCDHNFAVKGSPNKTVTSEGEDQSHFDPNYFGKGLQWQLPDLEESEASYKLAALNYAAFGRSIVNATEGGKLEIYPRMSLEEFLRK